MAAARPERQHVGAEPEAWAQDWLLCGTVIPARRLAELHAEVLLVRCNLYSEHLTEVL